MGERDVEYGNVWNGQLDGHRFSPFVCGQLLLYVNVFRAIEIGRWARTQTVEDRGRDLFNRRVIAACCLSAVFR